MGKLAQALVRIQDDLGLDASLRGKALVEAALADLAIEGGATLKESVEIIGEEMGLELEPWPGAATMHAAATIQRYRRGRAARGTAVPAARRQESARRHIVQEIRTTERTYNESLTRLADYEQQLRFQSSLGDRQDDEARRSRAFTAKSAGGSVEGLPSEADIKRIFGNARDLQPMSAELLAALDQRVGEKGAAWGPGSMVSDVLVRLAPHLGRAYREYSSKYSDMVDHLATCKRTFSRFDEALAALAASDPAGLPLESYLITPIQRLPRYMLLLGELRKHSTPSHADWESLLLAMQEIGKVASGVDAYMAARTAAISDDPETAMMEYSKALLANPEDPDLLMNRALACLKIGEKPLLEAALVDIGTVTTSRPKAFKGYAVQGEILLALGRGADAKRSFQTALSLEPLRPELSLGLQRADASLRTSLPEGIPRSDSEPEPEPEPAPGGGSAEEAVAAFLAEHGAALQVGTVQAFRAAGVPEGEWVRELESMEQTGDLADFLSAVRASPAKP